MYIYIYIHIVLTCRYLHIFVACHFVEFHNERRQICTVTLLDMELERGNIKLAVAQLQIVYKVPMERIDI